MDDTMCLGPMHDGDDEVASDPKAGGLDKTGSDDNDDDSGSKADD